MAQYITFSGVTPESEPFSPAVVSGNLVFCAGQIGIDNEGHVPTDLEAQVIQACENIKVVLAAAGSDLSKVIKTTLYITSFDHLDAINRVAGAYFKAPFAASTCVQVVGLFAAALVEIDVIAEK